MLSGIAAIMSYFGIGAFDDWRSTVDFLVTVDEFIINHAARPGLFIVFFSIFLATAVWPAVIGFLGHHRAIKMLWHLRSEGISHRNNHHAVANADDFLKWENGYNSWRR